MKYIYGMHPIKELLDYGIKGELYIVETKKEKTIENLRARALEGKSTIISLSKEDFIKKFGKENQSLVAFVFKGDFPFEISEELFIQQLKNDEVGSTLVLLDCLKDIGNLGSILRSSLLFNVDYIIIPKNNSASVNEVVIQRSAGAAFKLKIVYVTNLVRIIEHIKEQGFWVYGADMKGEAINTFEYPEKTAFVMGEEGTGLRRLVRETCDQFLRIPMNTKLDSLNVSVSTAILLYDRFVKLH